MYLTYFSLPKCYYNLSCDEKRIIARTIRTLAKTISFSYFCKIVMDDTLEDYNYHNDKDNHSTAKNYMYQKVACTYNA